MDQITAIDSDADAGSNIIRDLTTTGSTLTATMLRQMLDCIQLLGTTYAFSKRTTAYGIFGTQEIKGTGVANGGKLDGSMYAVGLRHTF
jgi:predicted porin